MTNRARPGVPALFAVVALVALRSPLTAGIRICVIPSVPLTICPENSEPQAGAAHAAQPSRAPTAFGFEVEVS